LETILPFVPPDIPFELPAHRGALLERIRATLARVGSLRDAVRLSTRRAEDRSALRVWQAARLAGTYADLLASPRHRAAAEFFLSDLYGPKDFTERDEEVARIVPTLASVLPIGAVQSLTLAVELDALSEELDAHLIDQLRGRQPAGLLSINEARYAGAYRACGNRQDRELQIALVDTIGRLLDRVAHKALVTAAMEVMRGPAHLAGLAELYDFLERGLRAFRQMDGAEEFLDIVRGRESAILEHLFAGTPEPFQAGPKIPQA
jgi:hypothetical protein